MSQPVHHSGAKVLGHVVAGLGVVLLLATFPFYLASGLSAPLWAIIVLLLFWAGLFLLAIRWFRKRPYWVICLPVLAVAIWVGAMTAGEQLLGWTA
jgi:hypothetical protein